MKLFTACVFVGLLCGTSASSAKWQSFKAKFAKQHADHEESYRLQRFLEKDAEIEAHNALYDAGLKSYRRQHSQYSDLSNEEFMKFALGYRAHPNVSVLPLSELTTMPSRPVKFDWRNSGIMTPVKSQGICGSCYAFATTSLLEAFLQWKNIGNQLDLSEQAIVDCSLGRYDRGFNYGCDGGSAYYGLQYFNEMDLVLGQEYPYTSGATNRTTQCRVSGPVRRAIKGKLSVRIHQAQYEDAIVDLLLQKGPLAISIAAAINDVPILDQLGDGIFDEDWAVGAGTNHAVVLVGYGTQNGIPYWTIKNSWDTTWGVRGYGKIRRGRNMLGIATGNLIWAEI